MFGLPTDAALGIVTVVMALLGVAVSLHRPESLYAPGKGWVKVIYVSTFAALGTIAIACVLKQSRETAIANQSLTHALSDLGQSTNQIADISRYDHSKYALTGTITEAK